MVAQVSFEDFKSGARALSRLEEVAKMAIMHDSTKASFRHSVHSPPLIFNRGLA